MLYRYSIKTQNKGSQTPLEKLEDWNTFPGRRNKDTWKLFKKDLSHGNSAFSNCHHTHTHTKKSFNGHTAFKI